MNRLEKEHMNKDSAEIAIVDYKGLASSLESVTSEDYIGRVLRESGRFYELEFLESLAELVRPGETVVDVGANIGNHTVFLARHCGCRVISYEPAPNTAAALRRNIARNMIEHQVEVRERALGSRQGSMVIDSYDVANVGGTTLKYKVDGDIPVTKLDDEHFPDGIALIKVDAEGMDVDVIQGAIRIIGEYRPVVAAEAMDDDSCADLMKIMERLGYTQAGIFNATPTYLFLPSESTKEISKLVSYMGKAISRLEQGQRQNEAKVSATGRYAERLHKAALESGERQISELTNTLKTTRSTEQEPTALISAYASRLANAEVREKNAREELRKVRDHQLYMKRSHALLIEDLEKRGLLEREIDGAERDRLQRNIAELEAAVLKSDAALQCQLTKFSEFESATLKARADVDRELTNLSALNSNLLSQIANLNAAESGLKAETSDLQRKLATCRGTLTKREAYGRDKARRLDTAMQLLSQERSHVRSLQSSSSMKIGRLITRSLRRPWSAVALMWRLPKMIVVEYWNARG